MSDAGEIDLRRVILQTLESWHAGGITHLTAVPVARAASVADMPDTPQPSSAAETRPLSAPAPVSIPEPSRNAARLPDAPVTPEALPAEIQPEPEPDMPKKSAPKNPKDRFDVETPEKPVAPAARQLNRDQRVAELTILSQKVAQCTRCTELASTRTQTVFGVGNPEAKVVFIGEAPGADEDAQGEPFVGRAGQLLNKIIEAMKLKREEIYICNILRCRPPGNRLPAPDEAGHCREYLDGQLSIINPEYIVCWGSCAAQNLLGMTESIGKLRGRFYQYNNARVLCTYHPSYLLRNPAAKKDVWEDMKILMRELGIPVE